MTRADEKRLQLMRFERWLAKRHGFRMWAEDLAAATALALLAVLLARLLG